MAARPISSSTISFGLVSLPVKLYSTSESSKRISFNWIDSESGNRVRMQYINPETGEPVDRDDMVKGYEFAKGQYVTFTSEEFKALEQPKSDSIEIVEFVPEGEVDRLYFDKAYYLGPDKGGARAYRLLSRALEETERVAIAKYATRGKQYLVTIRPYREGLMMEQLRYAEEVRDFSEVPLEEGEVKEAEMELAKQVIEQGSSDSWNPEDYHDEVRDRMLEMIEKKVEGEEIVTVSAEEPKTQIIDLMAALKASLEGESDDADEDSEGEGEKAAAS